MAQSCGRRHFLTDFKGKMESRWGYSESPIIDGGNLICTPCGNSAVMVALNKKTGEHLWSAEMPTAIGDRGHDGAGYSSIVIGQITGRKQYVQLTGRGVIGVDSESGDLLWTYNRIANGVANIPTPIVKGVLWKWSQSGTSNLFEHDEWRICMGAGSRSRYW